MASDPNIHPLWRHRALRYDGTFPFHWRLYFRLRAAWRWVRRIGR